MEPIAMIAKSLIARLSLMNPIIWSVLTPVMQIEPFRASNAIPFINTALMDGIQSAFSISSVFIVGDEIST